MLDHDTDAGRCLQPDPGRFVPELRPGDLRKIADSARNDLREGLGPEFAFEIQDLNPKLFVHKHLLGNVNGDPARRAAAHPQAAVRARVNETLLAPGEAPPDAPDAK